MVKLNLGCGNRNFGSDWTHIDGANYPHIDSHNVISLDYRDKSVDLIYASHLIEYFDRREVLPVLKEWKRVLRIDGMLRIAVPDFYQMARLYLVDSCDLFGFLMATSPFICGALEGFYGRPWGQDQRLQLFRWLKDWDGMNTYMYAPKDDLFHRSKWRELYPDSLLDELKSLIYSCHQKNIEFIYAS